MALTKVTGHVIKSDTNITSHNINSSGIITAISFDGNVSGVAITFTGDSTIGSLGITTNLTVGGNIDVDGHTELDNINIAGVSTHNEGIFLPDGKTAKFGNTSADPDLEIYHGGTNSIIKNSTGRLYIGANDITVSNRLLNETKATFNNNASVDLYYNGTKRFETTNTGAVVSGILTVTGNMNVEGVLTYQDVTNIDSIGIVTARSDIRGGRNLSVTGISTFSDHINLPDNKQIKFGGNADLQIFHDGSHNYILGSTGDLILKNSSANYIKGVTSTGAVELSYNGTKKFETGNTVNVNSNHFEITSGQQLRFDNSNNNRTSEILNDGSSGNSVITFKTNGGNRWTIDSTGHFIPGTAGAVDIGSASKEIGNVYIADDKRFYAGSDQNISLYHTSSNGINHLVGHPGNLFYHSTTHYFTNAAQSQLYAQFIQNSYCELRYSGAQKIKTSETGIDVTGEVKATQDYPNIRPVLDFNFAATKKLKPEMAFTRQGEASFHDGVGSVKFVSHNEPRFEHDILTGECKGLMFEGSGTNYSWHSRQFYSSGYPSGSWVPQNGGATPTITENTHTAPDGTSDGYYMADTISGATGTVFNGNVVKQEHTAGANVKHTFSIYIKLITATQATIYIRDGATGSVSSTNAVNTKTWQRVVVTSNNALTNSTSHAFYIGNTNGTIAVWGSQIERSDYVTSYIKTVGGANGTRITDKGIHLDGEDVADIFNEGEGTLIAEVILTQSVSNNPIVGFYEDFASNNRLELRGDASSTGVARFEAVVGGSSVTSLTTNLQHSGVNNVSKYAYAFQLNNYAGCVNGGSVTTDTSSTFPSGINSMMIGEAVYSVDAAVIVKRIMYYADRLPNSQLVTLTS